MRAYPQPQRPVPCFSSTFSSRITQAGSSLSNSQNINPSPLSSRIHDYIKTEYDHLNTQPANLSVFSSSSPYYRPSKRFSVTRTPQPLNPSPLSTEYLQRTKTESIVTSSFSSGYYRASKDEATPQPLNPPKPDLYRQASIQSPEPNPTAIKRSASTESQRLLRERVLAFQQARASAAEAVQPTPIVPPEKVTSFQLPPSIKERAISQPIVTRSDFDRQGFLLQHLPGFDKTNSKDASAPQPPSEYSNQSYKDASTPQPLSEYNFEEYKAASTPQPVGSADIRYQTSWVPTPKKPGSALGERLKQLSESGVSYPSHRPNWTPQRYQNPLRPPQPEHEAIVTTQPLNPSLSTSQVLVPSVGNSDRFNSSMGTSQALNPSSETFKMSNPSFALHNSTAHKPSNFPSTVSQLMASVPIGSIQASNSISVSTPQPFYQSTPQHFNTANTEYSNPSTPQALNPSTPQAITPLSSSSHYSGSYYGLSKIRTPTQNSKSEFIPPSSYGTTPSNFHPSKFHLSGLNNLKLQNAGLSKPSRQQNSNFPNPSQSLIIQEENLNSSATSQLPNPFQSNSLSEDAIHQSNTSQAINSSDHLPFHIFQSQKISLDNQNQSSASFPLNVSTCQPPKSLYSESILDETPNPSTISQYIRPQTSQPIQPTFQQHPTTTPQRLSPRPDQPISEANMNFSLYAPTPQPLEASSQVLSPQPQDDLPTSYLIETPSANYLSSQEIQPSIRKYRESPQYLEEFQSDRLDGFLDVNSPSFLSQTISPSKQFNLITPTPNSHLIIPAVTSQSANSSISQYIRPNLTPQPINGPAPQLHDLLNSLNDTASAPQLHDLLNSHPTNPSTPQLHDLLISHPYTSTISQPEGVSDPRTRPQRVEENIKPDTVNQESISGSHTSENPSINSENKANSVITLGPKNIPQINPDQQIVPDSSSTDNRAVSPENEYVSSNANTTQPLNPSLRNESLASKSVSSVQTPNDIYVSDPPLSYTCPDNNCASTPQPLNSDNNIEPVTPSMSPHPLPPDMTFHNIKSITSQPVDTSESQLIIPSIASQASIPEVKHTPLPVSLETPQPLNTSTSQPEVANHDMSNKPHDVSIDNPPPGSPLSPTHHSQFTPILDKLNEVTSMVIPDEDPRPRTSPHEVPLSFTTFSNLATIESERVSNITQEDTSARRRTQRPVNASTRQPLNASTPQHLNPAAPQPPNASTSQPILSIIFQPAHLERKTNLTTGSNEATRPPKPQELSSSIGSQLSISKLGLKIFPNSVEYLQKNSDGTFTPKSTKNRNEYALDEYEPTQPTPQRSPTSVRSLGGSKRGSMKIGVIVDGKRQIDRRLFDENRSVDGKSQSKKIGKAKF